MVLDREISPSVDWQKLGPLVFHHGLASKVDRLQAENKLEVPTKWSQAFRSHTREQVMRRHRYIQTLEWITEKLQKQSIPWIVLKGLPTAERYYQYPMDRLFSDVDILIPKKYRVQVNEIFNQKPLKLIEEKKVRENAHKMSFDDETHQLLPIEIHFGLGDFPIDEEILFLRKQGFRIFWGENFAVDVWVLNQKDELDYLIYHACVQHRLSHLKWMMDFKEMGRDPFLQSSLSSSSRFVADILGPQKGRKHRYIWRQVLRNATTSRSFKALQLRSFFTSPLSAIVYALRSLWSKRRMTERPTTH